jgi:hypothetical protein
MRPAAGLVAALLLVAGCGGDHAAPTPPPAATVFPTLAKSDCAAWTEMSNATRRAFVEQLHIYYSGKVSAKYGVGNTIPDSEALVKLTQICRRPHYDAVQLYRIYGPLVAFTPPG